MADGRYGGKEDWTIGVKEQEQEQEPDQEPDQPPWIDPSTILRCLSVYITE
jgi:hypothetical protein